jgi:hypothetical protein
MLETVQRRWLLVLALGLAGIGAAAAGFGGLFDPKPLPIALPQPLPEASFELASALEELDGTPGARFSAVATVVDPDFGRKPVRIAGRGVFNCDGDVRMTVNYLPAFRRTAPGTNLEELGLAKRDLVGEIVGIGEDFYVRLPLLRKLYPGAKPWIHARYGAEDAGALELLARDDPDCSDFLPYLEYGLPEPTSDETSISDLGADTVRGVETTHYALSVSPAEIAAEFGVSAEDLRRAVELLGGDAFDIDFWIDAEGLIRRVSYQDVWPGE